MNSYLSRLGLALDRKEVPIEVFSPAVGRAFLESQPACQFRTQNGLPRTKVFQLEKLVSNKDDVR